MLEATLVQPEAAHPHQDRAAGDAHLPPVSVPGKRERHPARRRLERRVGVVGDQDDGCAGGDLVGAGHRKVEIGPADVPIVDPRERNTRITSRHGDGVVVEDAHTARFEEPADPLDVVGVVVMVAEDGKGPQRPGQPRDRVLVVPDFTYVRCRHISAVNHDVRLKRGKTREDPCQRAPGEKRTRVNIGEEQQPGPVKRRGEIRNRDLGFGDGQIAFENRRVPQRATGNARPHLAAQKEARPPLDPPEPPALRVEMRTRVVRHGDFRRIEGTAAHGGIISTFHREVPWRRS